MSEQLVVIGVDGSPASFTALRWALACRRRTELRLRAVRCWTPVVALARGWETAVTAEPVPTIIEQQVQAKRELAQIVMAALCWLPDRATRVVVQQRVVRGPAGPGLVSQAAGADLLVIGHGHRSMHVTAGRSSHRLSHRDLGAARGTACRRPLPAGVLRASRRGALSEATPRGRKEVHSHDGPPRHVAIRKQGVQQVNPVGR